MKIKVLLKQTECNTSYSIFKEYFMVTLKNKYFHLHYFKSLKTFLQNLISLIPFSAKKRAAVNSKRQKSKHEMAFKNIPISEIEFIYLINIMIIKEAKVEKYFFHLKRVLDCLCHVFIINKRQRENREEMHKKT